MNGDNLVFPDATVRADKHDADHWLSQANMDAAPKEAKGSFQAATAALNPYIAGPGHTPGHTTYVVESKGKKLVLRGDLMHVAAVQFAEPSVTVRFAVDSTVAAKARKLAYADAAKSGYWVGAAHLAFPEPGHLRAEGSGYLWIPANYSSLR